MRGSNLTVFARPGDVSPFEGFMRAGNHALGLLFPESPAQPPPPRETFRGIYTLALCAVVPATLFFHFFGPRKGAVGAEP